MLWLTHVFCLLCIAGRHQTGANTGSSGHGEENRILRGELEANFVQRQASEVPCDLRRLAAAADCAFFSCAESLLQCQHRGFSTLSLLGGQFCTSFKQRKSQFTSEAGRWIDGLVRCLINRLMMHLRTVAKSCASIHEVALQSPQHCFLEPPPGMCSVLLEERNRQALADVFKQTGAGHEDQLYLMHQTEELAASCIDRNLHMIIDPNDSPDQIRGAKSASENAVTSFRNLLPRPTDQFISAEHDIDHSCVDKGNSGDCGFYECFHRRFPCPRSHLLQFEAVSCRKLADISRNSIEEDVVKSYQRCLMVHLLPLYRGPRIQCSQLEGETSSQRRQCLQDAGLCRVPKVDWLIDRWTELGGFPVRMPVWYSIFGQLGGLFTHVQPTYFRHVSLLKGQIADVQCRCRASSAGLCAAKYRHTFTDDTKHVVEAAKGTERKDEGCRDAGGTCQEKGRRCDGTHATGLCKGSSSWSCCLPKDYKCTLAGGTCYNRTENCCLQGEFLTGKCDGAAERQCCIPRPPFTTPASPISESKRVCSTNPNNRIRGKDCEGKGWWGAPRGNRIHEGIDIICTPGANITAPIDGFLSLSAPYRNPEPHQLCINKGVNIGDRSKKAVSLWYVEPVSSLLRTNVTAGTVVAHHIGIHCAYSTRMTDHTHLTLWKEGQKVDPTSEFGGPIDE